MTQELDVQRFTGLLNVESGELLVPSVENAAACIMAARAMKERANAIVREATDYLVSLSEHRGTKTLHGEGETVTLNGGTSIDYDPQTLMECLEEAGCPQERINAAVTMHITYKVDRSVLRQLAGANEDYKAAIQLAERQVERAYAATIKLRRNTDAE